MPVNLKDDIRPISYIKTNAAEMMRYVAEHKSPVIITQNGEARAALLDIGSFQEMRDAFNLLKMIQLSEKDYAAGHYKQADRLFSELKDRYETGE